ncbi:hypothetical protein [Klenkia brasiliensis]|uniref:Uncharacterized protein n=1 Tax=Klenkia brasiliensis TaxID=333142 RepID=A0A1G7PYN4_9ACTN|nr:hypothetical protein [Klenkia brasiliensis]SDF91366.1 hypothetical protein SAMN05660324_1272 [Klenkia brasiliensis]
MTRPPLAELSSEHRSGAVRRLAGAPVPEVQSTVGDVVVRYPYEVGRFRF